MNKENSPPTNLNLIYPSDIAEIKLLLHEIREQRANVLQDYITKADFLQRFDIKPGMLYKLINDGKLKIYRIMDISVIPCHPFRSKGCHFSMTKIG